MGLVCGSCAGNLFHWGSYYWEQCGWKAPHHSHEKNAHRWYVLATSNQVSGFTAQLNGEAESCLFSQPETQSWLRLWLQSIGLLGLQKRPKAAYFLSLRLNLATTHGSMDGARVRSKIIWVWVKCGWPESNPWALDAASSLCPYCC